MSREGDDEFEGVGAHPDNPRYDPVDDDEDDDDGDADA